MRIQDCQIHFNWSPALRFAHGRHLQCIRRWPY